MNRQAVRPLWLLGHRPDVVQRFRLMVADIIGLLLMLLLFFIAVVVAAAAAAAAAAIEPLSHLQCLT